MVATIGVARGDARGTNEGSHRHQLRHPPELRRVPRARGGRGGGPRARSRGGANEPREGTSLGPALQPRHDLPVRSGSDGVGRTREGERVYFAFPRAPFGTMAERSVVRRAYAIGIPDDVDDVTAAAIGNPGMSSWAALVERARVPEGGVGARVRRDGNLGPPRGADRQWLGARRVIAMGRNERALESLRALGADATIALNGEPATWGKAVREEVARDHIDVVLDYLWGPPAEQILSAFSGHGVSHGEPRVRLVQIGSMAGATVTLSASSLRSSGVELIGSGLGSVSWERLVAAVGEVMKVVSPAKLAVDAEPLPLARVAEAWAEKSDKRLVLTMGGGD